MSRSARRRAQRQHVADLIAAGYARRIRSHYQTADIADAVRSDIAEARLRRQHSVTTDPEWAYRDEHAARAPLSLITGVRAE